MDKPRNKKGITLVALVITIIVLLILAGVSISMVSSQDGILKKTIATKERQNNVSTEEKVRMTIQEALIDGEGTINLATDGYLADKLKAIDGVSYNNEGKITLNGEKYDITSNGNLKKIEEKTFVIVEFHIGEPKGNEKVYKVNEDITWREFINDTSLNTEGWQIAEEEGEERVWISLNKGSSGTYIADKIGTVSNFSEKSVSPDSKIIRDDHFIESISNNYWYTIVSWTD